MENDDRLKLMRSTVDKIDHLRELTKKKMKVLDELEYSLLQQYLWESRTGFRVNDMPDGFKIVTRFKWQGSHRTKGSIIIKRTDVDFEKYDAVIPVRISTGMGHTMGSLNTPADIWDETGEIPDRFFLNFLFWNNKEPHQRRIIKSERSKRLRKEAQRKEREEARKEESANA